MGLSESLDSFDIKGRYVSRCGNPQVSPEWLERESPGRKSTGTRVGHRAARRRSHIARFCPRRLGFREEGPHDGVRRQKRNGDRGARLPHSDRLSHDNRFQRVECVCYQFEHWQAVLDEAPGTDGALAPRTNFLASRSTRACFPQPTLCSEGDGVGGACGTVVGSCPASRDRGLR